MTPEQDAKAAARAFRRADDIIFWDKVFLLRLEHAQKQMTGQIAIDSAQWFADTAVKARRKSFTRGED